MFARRWISSAGLVPALLIAQLLVLGCPRAALAALGDAAASISLDSQALSATPHVAQHPAFTVHEMHTAAGTVIREFVATSGRVFAVSWRGPFKPSMPLLLGQFFEQYARAPRSPGSTRSRLVIEQPQLVVHAAGHMRSFSGIAYAPQLLPPNVLEADLQ